MCIYKNPLDKSPMETCPLEEVNGVWSIQGPSSWEGCYYVYKVSVYHPSTLKVETCYANDPYARGYGILHLSLNLMAYSSYNFFLSV